MSIKTVKRKRQRLVCAALVLVLAALLSGCGQKNRDAEYVGAVLDCLYKGRTAELCEITQSSEIEAASLHDKAVADQTSYLGFMFGIGECSADSAQKLRDKVASLYSLMKYGVEETDGKIIISYSPCYAIQELKQRLSERLERYEGETEDDYAELVAEILGDILSEGPSFGPEEKLEASIEEGVITQGTLGGLDLKILPY